MSMHQPTSTTSSAKRAKHARGRGRGCLNKAALLVVATAVAVVWLLAR